jgi:hypothetical protein
MMRAMGKRTITAMAALALVAWGCGGKGADSPGTCPAGTTLKGSDCVPSGDDDSAGSSGGGGSGGTAKKGDDGDTPSGGSGGGGDATQGGSTAYDKEAVDVQLKRAARQVKANCGAASDDEGKAAGPWGSTKVSVVLGRNGHVKQVTIPSPYDGKPVGLCVVHAFQKIQFPPYAGSTDVVLDWDIEIIQPKP